MFQVWIVDSAFTHYNITLLLLSLISTYFVVVESSGDHERERPSADLLSRKYCDLSSRGQTLFSFYCLPLL